MATHEQSMGSKSKSGAERNQTSNVKSGNDAGQRMTAGHNDSSQRVGSGNDRNREQKNPGTQTY